MRLRKGILIAIEGIDGSGKTTQALRLCEHFKQKGFSVRYLKEPTDGKFGKTIRSLAKNGRHEVKPDEELELFIQDRIEDCRDNILPALKRNELVFIDRYYFSSIAYQGALGLDTDQIWKRNEQIAFVPDLVLIFDVPVQTGLERISHFRQESHDHFEKKDYLEKVRAIFRSMGKPYIRLIDSSGDSDAVFNHALAIVQETVTPLMSPAVHGRK